MQELLIATTNKGKLKELQALLADLDLKVTSLSEYPNAPNVIEDGHSFSENAAKKAVTLSLFSGKLALGEDSGLEVRALDNQPGIYSARFAGEDASDRDNNAKLMRWLRDVPEGKREARYRCCAVLARGERVIASVEGSCRGVITRRARGKNGFGYDPYFLIPRYGKTFGELDPAIKAQISHRGRALRKMKQVLVAYGKK